MTREPLRARLFEHLRENWGTPFVVSFMVILIASVVELGLGYTDTANSTAMYAFFGLVVGVALQIASYVKHGEGTLGPRGPAPPLTVRTSKYEVSRKALAVVLIIVFSGVGSGGSIPPVPNTISPNLEGLTLTNNVGRPNVLIEPNGTTIVILTVGA